MPKPLKYLNAEGQYATHAYEALKRNFRNRERFDQFLQIIEPPERKDLFLRLASFYRFLVKEGHWRFPSRRFSLQYIDETFKLISVFSLMEASLGKDEYIDFYAYLTRKSSPIQYPVSRKTELDELYRKYKEESGSIQKVVRFFEALDEPCKNTLVSKFKMRSTRNPKKPREIREWKYLSIGELAKHIYRMRSDFVHQAEFVLSLNEGSFLSVKGNRVTLNHLSLNDLCRFFEHGLLIQFGYVDSLPHPSNGS